MARVEGSGGHGIGCVRGKELGRGRVGRKVGGGRVEREETGDAAGFLVGVVGALYVVCSVDRAEPACCHGLHHECSPADASV